MEKEKKMSKILYKAKRTDNHEWIEGVPTYPTHEIGKCYMVARVLGRHECFVLEDAGKVLLIHDAYEVDPATVCRCVGMTDKNGKDIFESDICMAIFSDLIGNPEESKIVIPEITEYLELMKISTAEELQVIGNIHDEGKR